MDPYKPIYQDLPRDFHSPNGVTVGELIEGGFIDWSAPEWQFDSYNAEQAKRFGEKFNARFFMLTIGITPPALWRMQVIRRLNELMPKFKILYKRIDDGIDWTETGDSYDKERHVFSDFPASLIGDREALDYASTATDADHETVQTGDQLDKFVDFVDRYNDLDLMLLEEMEPFFSSLVSVCMPLG